MPGIDGRELAGHVRALPGTWRCVRFGIRPDTGRLSDIPARFFFPKLSRRPISSVRSAVCYAQFSVWRAGLSVCQTESWPLT